MPLTRHFYESDEVLSALYYCSSISNRKETEFWCSELIWSGYSSEAISVLFQSWLWQKGPFYLRWLLHGLDSDTVTEEQIRCAAIQLSSFGISDNSLWRILMSPCTHARVSPKTQPFLPSHATESIMYLYRALYQGKAQCAWAIVQNMVLAKQDVWAILREYGSYVDPQYTACFDILERYETLLGYRSEQYDRVILCCSTLMLCLSDTKRAISFKSMPPISSILSVPIGRKAARIFPIPSLALYGLLGSPTKRGLTPCSQYHTNGLYDIEKGIQGCPFWDEVRSRFQRNGSWVSDDTMEAFYEEYFPDDIPDEWSHDEKMKSHGQGLLNAGHTMSVQRFARVHFTKPCRLAFCMTPIAREDIPSLSYTELILKPLRKKYVI